MLSINKLIKTGVIATVLAITAPAIAKAAEQTPPIDTLVDNETYLPGISEKDELSKATPLPIEYSAAEAGLVTKEKNQKQTGLCWAFSSISMAETNMIKKKKISLASADYSEYHLAYFMYHQSTDPLGLISEDSSVPDENYEEDFLNCGGTFYSSMGTFSNWKGPVNEEEAPFSENPYKTLSNDIAYDKDVAHLENSDWINPEDTEEIKQAILDNGSVCANILYHDSFLSSDRDSYYEGTYNGINHAIAIIGWDDNYSADNFKAKPAGNGAWLAKDSYGTWHNGDGLFWVSYYTSSIKVNPFITASFAPATNYDYNYQYDGTINTTSYTSYPYAKTAYMANVFTSQHKENIAAVGFYTLNPDVNYEVSVYTGIIDNEIPTSGTKKATCSGYIKHEGFHTIELPREVAIEKNVKYSVVVKMTIPESTEEKEAVKIPVEVKGTTYVGHYVFTPKSNTGESFTSSNGAKWTDRNNQGNVRVKAYTNVDNKKPSDITDAAMDHIEIDTMPYKTIYRENEEFDSTGMKVSCVYADDTRKDITDECLISGYDKSLISKQTITVVYPTAGYTTTYDIYVLPVTNNLGVISNNDEYTHVFWNIEYYKEGLHTKIYRQTDDGEEILISDNENDYDDYEIKKGHRYRYRAVTYFSIDDNEYQIEEETDYIYIYPSKVNNLTTEYDIENSTINVRWDNTDCSGYIVLYYINDDVDEKIAADTTDNHATINVKRGNVYRVFVIPYLENLEDETDNYYGADTSSDLITAKYYKPVIKSLFAKKPGQVTITFTNDNKNTNYRIYRKEGKYGVYRCIKKVKSDNSSTTSYTDQTVKIGRKYYYYVTAEKNINMFSNLKKVIAKSATKSCTVSNVGKAKCKLTKKSGYLKISLSKVKYASGYEIQRSLHKDYGYKTIRKQKNTASYNAWKIKSKTKYYFRVRAYSMVNSKKVYGKYSRVVYGSIK